MLEMRRVHEQRQEALMGVAQAVRSLFSSAVRQLGSDYAESGAVEIIQHDDGWAEVEVEGSRGWHYAVSLQKFGEAKYSLDCTCPHFEDGNYCKHLWAAILVADEQGLFDEKVTPRLSGNRSAIQKPSSAKAKPKAKQVPWKKQLDRQFHYLSSEAPWLGELRPRRIHYLLEVADSGDGPVIALHQQEQSKDGSWGVVKPLSVDHTVLTAFNTLAGIDPEDQVALGVLLSNRLQQPRRY